MKRLLFIVNPCSGKEQIRSKLIDILDIFTKAGYQVQTHITQCQGDARHAAECFGKGGFHVLQGSSQGKSSYEYKRSTCSD